MGFEGCASSERPGDGSKVPAVSCATSKTEHHAIVARATLPAEPSHVAQAMTLGALGEEEEV